MTNQIEAARQKASEARAALEVQFNQGLSFSASAAASASAAVRELALTEVVALLRTKRTPEGETITSASHAAYFAADDESYETVTIPEETPS